MITRKLDKLKSTCPDPKASNIRMTKEGEVAAHQCLEDVLHMLAGDALAIADEGKTAKTAATKYKSVSLFAVRIASAVQTKAFLASERKAKLTSILGDMAKMADDDVRSVFAGDDPINFDGCERLSSRKLKRFFMEGAKGNVVRVPATVMKDMRCFIHYFLYIHLRHSMNRALKHGRLYLDADFFHF